MVLSNKASERVVNDGLTLKKHENIGKMIVKPMFEKNNNSDFLAILSPFNQRILGEIMLTIIVYTDYCNSRKKLEIVVSNGFI